MPIYESGPASGGPSGPGGGGHAHQGWELPFFIGGRQLCQVTQGNYLPGTLEVQLSAAPDGEEGYSTVTEPAYLETDPSQGFFNLVSELPVGWLIRVRYAHT